MQVPRLEKIVVNIGLGEALTNAKAVDAAVGDLTQITGQKPIVTKAKKSIAQFRVRTGNPIGAQGHPSRRADVGLPRAAHARSPCPASATSAAIPGKSFDGRGNYTLGPARNSSRSPRSTTTRWTVSAGWRSRIVTTAKTDEESRRLLELLGMPFAS